MNFKYKKLLPLALVAALLLTGCTAPVSSGVSTAGDSTTAAVSQIAPDADAVGSEPAEVIALSDTAPAQAAEESVSEAYDEAFSGRDLSGAYDSEVVSIRLSGDSAAADSDAVLVSGSTVTVTAAGTYVLSGELNGTVVVNASKDDKVQLVLDGATIHSDTFAAIYVLQADKVFVTLADGTVNRLSNGGVFTPIDENDVDAVIYAKDDITLNGTGRIQNNTKARWRVHAPGREESYGISNDTARRSSFTGNPWIYAGKGRKTVQPNAGAPWLTDAGTWAGCCVRWTATRTRRNCIRRHWPYSPAWRSKTRQPTRSP